MHFHGLFVQFSTLLVNTCFCRVSHLGWSSNCKHSGTPDRKRLWWCVCICVSPLICSWSFVVFCCYQRESSFLPVSHNAMLSLSGWARGRALLGCEEFSLLYRLCLSLHFVYVGPFLSTLPTFNLWPWKSFTTSDVFCCLSPVFKVFPSENVWQ